ncbi:ChaN family lipoprotein [Bdellovibrio bacteriovorus]|uniref:ChaN family lipoprotein n=1 Tax=Bdellovibrio bacteriovorus TaxID=959 RepID=UPI001E5F2EF6|nr:ChaN family lipoprotein [Bdellovibrio bacteriovorus]
MNDLQKWIRIRKDLYLQMEKQVRHRLGRDTPELMRYQKVYEKEFAKKWTASTKEALWEQMSHSQVVMVGDFHALHQSQKAQARILRHIPKDRKTILAVEFLEAADQEKIDRYMSGKMSERDFLKSVQWQTKWGFPWEYYRPLLRWAQKNKVAVRGINRSYKKRNATTLKSRDVFAGKKIAELVKAHPDHLVFVIYGDLHLAAEHIPAEIVRILGAPFAKRILRIFQNSEKIYFQLLNRELEASTDLVRLSQNIFCLMSVPPWVKWQNYLMYLEQTYDLGLHDDDDDDDDEDLLDYTDHVGRYVKIISEELGLTVSTSNLSVYTARDSSFWSQVREHYDPKKLRWIELMIADENSFYLPEIGAAYLARGTVNHAASLAMHFVHAQVSGEKQIPMDVPADFLRLIWKQAVAYFGSKIINHKRKTDTIADIKASLATRGPSDLGKEALQLALAQKMHELMVITGVPGHRLQARPRKKWSYVLAASLLGGMMGERLFGGYQKKLIKAATLATFLKKPLGNPHFDVVYYEALEVIESLPAPFLSKKEKL